MGSIIEQARQDPTKSTLSLALSPLFQPRYNSSGGSTREETFRRSYERAVAINKYYSQSTFFIFFDSISSRLISSVVVACVRTLRCVFCENSIDFPFQCSPSTTFWTSAPSFGTCIWTRSSSAISEPMCWFRSSIIWSWGLWRRLRGIRELFVVC